jgi:hypothetical protein
MVHHVTLSRESLGANRTTKWFLISVNSNMNFKIWPFRELLAATWVRASVRLGTIMQVIVRFQTTFSRKIFVAARKSALESLYICLVERSSVDSRLNLGKDWLKIPNSPILFRDIYVT